MTDLPDVDAIMQGLAPVLRTLAKLAATQHAAPPMLVTSSTGTLSIQPHYPSYAPTLTGLLAEERAAYEQRARCDARWRARQYTQRPSAPQRRALRAKQQRQQRHS